MFLIQIACLYFGLIPAKAQFIHAKAQFIHAKAQFIHAKAQFIIRTVG